MVHKVPNTISLRLAWTCMEPVKSNKIVEEFRNCNVIILFTYHNCCCFYCHLFPVWDDFILLIGVHNLRPTLLDIRLVIRLYTYSPLYLKHSTNLSLIPKSSYASTTHLLPSTASHPSFHHSWISPKKNLQNPISPPPFASLTSIHISNLHSHLPFVLFVSLIFDYHIHPPRQPPSTTISTSYRLVRKNFYNSYFRCLKCPPQKPYFPSFQNPKHVKLSNTISRIDLSEKWNSNNWGPYIY